MITLSACSALLFSRASCSAGSCCGGWDYRWRRWNRGRPRTFHDIGHWGFRPLSGDSFHERNLIGIGGFGNMYRGSP